jgi:hypothetical protein
MKEIYNESKPKPVAKPRPRKRKRANVTDETELILQTETKTKTEIPVDSEITPKHTAVLGPGRPTKDDALLREANYDSDNNPQMAIREVQLLSHNDAVRKKIKILTKHPEDIKCFAIKHCASYEYVAIQRKKALEEIKELRNTLKSLQYIETNLEPYIKDMSAF